jgi:hypothetical protein
VVSKFDQPPEKQEIYQQFTKLQSPLSFKIKSLLNDILENMKTCQVSPRYSLLSKTRARQWHD